MIPCRFWIPISLGVLGTAGFCVWVAMGSPPALATLFDLWVYNGVLFLAAAVFFIRALSSSELRGAWICFGVGLTAWALGDTYWVVALADVKHPAYPSLADAGYLLTLPCLFVGIALCIKHRIGGFRLASWFDGAIGALAAAALAAALLGPALIGLTHGDAGTVFTNLAYPVGDVLLVGLIVGALVVGGLRGAWTLLLVGAGLLIWAAADMAYLYTVATDSYVSGWSDVPWLVGALVMSASAAASASRSSRGNGGHSTSLLVPALSTAAAVGILVLDHFGRLHVAAVWLAAATIAAIAARLLLSSRENDRLVAALFDDSVTDALTGLANRRRLFTDLEDLLRLERVSITGPRVFAIFDLDGFKAYNDSFGHPAGDALLRRLGGRLPSVTGPGGGAYRLGGDEFCILFDPAGRDVSDVIEAARDALSEQGEGFTITASCGAAELPREADTASEALRLADHRMYAQKGSRSTRAEQQTQDVLLRVLREREPELGSHLRGVAELAAMVARELALDAEEVDIVTRAAELHDIGKIAIPDAILRKPGVLDAAEWELMRRHTVIGERILGAAPALRPVASIVRSSHERWDGAGYPDGLEGEATPLGSRIIFVCDAFDAMTSERPYGTRRSRQEAIAELRRNAGTQFDPEVVEAFCRLLQHERGPGDFTQQAETDPPRARQVHLTT